TPRALAVLRLITSSNFVGSFTGKSEGFVPCKILCMRTALRRKISGTSAPFDDGFRPLQCHRREGGVDLLRRSGHRDRRDLDAGDPAGEMRTCYRNGVVNGSTGLARTATRCSEGSMYVVRAFRTVGLAI